MARGSVTGAIEILTRAQQHGVEMVPRGGKLKMRAPRKPPDELLAAIRRHKPELLRLLEQPPQTPRMRAIAEYRREGDHCWRAVLGAPDQTYEQLAKSVRQRFPDVAEVRPYRRGRS